MSKYPVSKSDYENFRSVVEEIIKDFKKRPTTENRFYKNDLDQYDDETENLHAYAFFLQEIYSFRFPSLIIGYAKRQGLQWINDFLQRKEYESLFRTLKYKRKYDSPDYTKLLFKERQMPIKDTQIDSSNSLFSVPILEVKFESDNVEVRVVERIEIETALELIISYGNSRKRA